MRSMKHEKEPRNKLYSLSLEPLEIAEFVSVLLPLFSEIEISVSFFLTKIYLNCVLEILNCLCKPSLRFLWQLVIIDC